MTETAPAPTTAEIRAWALSQPGMFAGRRGRLTQAVKDAYAAAHPAR